MKIKAKTNSKKMDGQIHLPVPNDLLCDIDQVAEYHGLTRASLIRQLLRKGIDKMLLEGLIIYAKNHGLFDQAKENGGE